MPDIATLVYEVMQTEAPGQITRLVGLDLDGIVANGKTALAISLEGGARRDRQPVTLELIRAGARSLGSEPALPAICRSGVPELVLAFEARNPGELERDPHARRLLHVCRGDVAALTADPPDPAADPYPTLLFAIRTGSVAMVEALLRAGYRADPRDADDRDAARDAEEPLVDRALLALRGARDRRSEDAARLRRRSRDRSPRGALEADRLPPQDQARRGARLIRSRSPGARRALAWLLPHSLFLCAYLSDFGRFGVREML